MTRSQCILILSIDMVVVSQFLLMVTGQCMCSQHKPMDKFCHRVETEIDGNPDTQGLCFIYIAGPLNIERK